MSKEIKKPDVSIEIKAGEEGRLDRFLSTRFEKWSRTSLQRLINGRFILIDGHAVSPNHKLLKGQSISIIWPKKETPTVRTKKEPLPFPVLFEDDSILVINKPPHLVVHPSAGHKRGATLIDLVAPYIEKGEWPDEMRPGLVHRLDRDTSGVLVLAKTPEVHSKLSLQFARRQVKKTYIALVRGKVETPEGTIESHLGRHPGQRQRFAVASDKGRWSVTKFVVKEHIGDKATLIELQPLTGRTHQIRVHLASFGHPIIGDHVYGKNEKEMQFVKRQLLHAQKLQIQHPISGKTMQFEASIPDDFHESVKVIRLQNV